MAEANSPTNELRMITINIHGGFMNKLKDNDRGFLDVIRAYDVIMLQDTRVGENKDSEFTGRLELDFHRRFEFSPEAKGYMTFFSTNCKGVGIIINTRHEDTNVFHNNGNYIGVCTKIGGQRYTFISIYWRSSETEELLNQFLQDVNVQNVRQGFHVIGGDFNVTINPLLDIVHDNQRHISRRQIFNRIWPQDYTDVWRNEHPDAREYTLTTPRKGEEPDQQTRLDYFFMRQTDIGRVTACEILTNNLPTDHRAVSLTLRVPDALESVTEGLRDTSL